MAIGLASARASGEMDKVQEQRERERAQRGRERGKEGGRESWSTKSTKGRETSVLLKAAPFTPF